MKLLDLKFPVKVWDFNAGKIKDYNLFSSLRVLSSIAIWRTMPEEQREERVSDPVAFCFGDTWGRIEWEFSIDKDGNMGSPFQEDGMKTDVFSHYVLPNEGKLMKMVNSVSENSCRLFLKKERGHFNGKRK